MTSRVVSVSAQTSLERARFLLTRNRFSALPVVDERHRLIGIITTLDLLRVETSPPTSGPTTVGAVMTSSPMAMTPDTAVTIIAHRLRTYGERRVMPIVDRGMLVGIVTRGDLLRPAPAGGPIGRLLSRGRGRDRAPRTDWAGPPRSGGTAAEVMTPSERVVVVWETSPVGDAAALLRENRFTALPVLDDDEYVVGVISEADLIPDRLSGRRTAPARTVGGAMTSQVVAARHDASVADLARTMVDRGVRMLPILGADDRLAGVVSRGDLLRRQPEPTS